MVIRSLLGFSRRYAIISAPLFPVSFMVSTLAFVREKNATSHAAKKADIIKKTPRMINRKRREKSIIVGLSKVKDPALKGGAF